MATRSRTPVPPPSTSARAARLPSPGSSRGRALPHPPQPKEGSTIHHAQKYADVVASYLDDRIPGPEPYHPDEATEYGETDAEKAAGIGVDTGAFGLDLDSMCPVMSVDYGTLPGTLVQVEFQDGSKLHWGERQLILREL